MNDMSDFQKQFLSKGVGNKLFTQPEFDEALRLAQAEIMSMAIYTTKQAINIEREECAKIAHDMEKERTGGDDKFTSDIARAILTRLENKADDNA
jgi:hypothetical protein